MFDERELRSMVVKLKDDDGDIGADNYGVQGGFGKAVGLIDSLIDCFDRNECF